MVKPFDPDDVKQVTRLREAEKASYDKLQGFRDRRREMLRQFAGYHYGERGNAAPANVPVNLLELTLHIYGMQLAANEPRVLVSTPHKSLKAEAATLELATTQTIEEVDLGDRLWEAVQDALFCLGVLKIGLEPDGEVGTRTFTQTVDFEDYTFDMTALGREDFAFEGNRYMRLYDEVMDSPEYNKKAKALLQPDDYNDKGEKDDEDAAEISRGTDTSDTDTFAKRIELLDLWLPRDQLIVTLAAKGGNEVLQVVEWDGPAKGPYHVLSFQRVPRQIMPLSIAMMTKDMHDLVNELYRKTANQARRQKELTTYTGNAADDAARVVQSMDGETIRLDQGNDINEVKFGGPDPATLAFTINAKDVHSWVMGNLDSLGGLSAQSETLGQDRMLEANSSKRIADMQQRTVKYAREVISTLMWYEWTDPIRERLLTKTIPGTDIGLSVRWSADTRRGNYLDYNFKVEPYSMQYKSPGQKVQTLTQLWQTFILPYLPQLEARGIVVDFQSLLQLLAKYTDLTELNDILTFYAPTEEGQAPPQGGQPQGAAVTHRTNERINTPGTTRQGNDQIMQQLLSGSRLQDSQRSALSRVS
jgi:hypothetical protein